LVLIFHGYREYETNEMNYYNVKDDTKTSIPKYRNTVLLYTSATRLTKQLKHQLRHYSTALGLIRNVI